MIGQNWIFNRFLAVFLLCFGVILIQVTPVWAATGDASNEEIDKLAEVGNALLKYLVLAIIIESAMSTLFQWRWFQKASYRKGLKTPITVFVAFVVLSTYPTLDVLTDVLKVFGDKSLDVQDGGAKEWITRLLTALLLAGGSSSFVSLYQKLGLRSPVGSVEKKVAEQTSLEVTVDRNQIVDGAVTIQLDEGAPVTVQATQGLFQGVTPGRHLVIASATATSGSNTVYESQVIDVNPAKLNSCDIKFG
jgi:hypothetical protein